MPLLLESNLKDKFATSTFFRKTSTLKASDIRLSDGGEHIVTIVDGKQEREGTTKPGDRVVTGTKGEEYIITREKFPTLYEQDPHNPEIFRSKNCGWAIQLDEDATIERADQVPVSGKKGDALFYSPVTQTLNVIDAPIFDKSYKPEPSDAEAFSKAWGSRPAAPAVG